MPACFMRHDKLQDHAKLQGVYAGWVPARQVEVVCLVQQLLVIQLVLHHELRQIPNHLAAGRHLYTHTTQHQLSAARPGCIKHDAKQTTDGPKLSESNSS